MPKKEIVHTIYVRVLKWKAFQVEIHPIKLSSTSPCQLETAAWFQDRHMQEVLMLLKDIMQERAMLKSKDLDTIKMAKSEILTGSTVRLGYSFKRKEEHQICLLPADFSDTHNSEADSDVTSRYRNLVLHSEKLVVYTYPLERSSQQNMIQLLSHQSQSQKVSISNYFHKTSSTVTSSQSITKDHHEFSKTSRKYAKTENEPAVVSDDPFSATRKRTIKSIIKNSGPKLSNTKKRKVAKTVGISSCTEPGKQIQQKFVCNDENVSCSIDDSKSSRDKTEDWNSPEKLVKLDGECFVLLQNCVTDRSKHYFDVQSETRKIYGKTNSTAVPRESRKKTGDDKVKSLTDGGSLDLQISHQEKSLSLSVINDSGNAKRMFRSHCLEKVKTSIKINDELASVHPSRLKLKPKEEEKSLSSLHKSSITENMFKSLTPEEVMTPTEIDHELSSFCTSDQTDTSQPSESPQITPCSPGSVETKTDCDRKGAHPFLKSKCLSVSMLRKIAEHKDKMPESPKSVRTNLKNQRSPLSSSLSDDPYEFKFSPKKTKMEKDLKQDMVQKKGCSKRIQELVQKKSCAKGIQNSFHKKGTKRTILGIKSDKSQKDTEEDVAHKEQEKLPVIFYKKRDRWKKRLTEIFPLPEESSDHVASESFESGDQADIGSGSLKESSDSFVCLSRNDILVNDHLSVEATDSGCSSLQSESRSNLAELTKELKQIQSVDSIKKIQLEKLVFSYEPYLRKLFQGQVSCWRHQEYKKGGSSRANLNYYVHFGLFTEEQQDVVMETLMSIFCKKHHRYLDYIMKVLLPEILIKILMEMKELSHNEADTLLATSQQ
ncbi:uncharacterized protein LOC121371534 [Gigantopelta aegis]|uniref:uncharacterized protein LOC121371534 n=1 Tax=Gigantopelta aegis TaxID=1735272 RepID=UPI001B889197|nr:uncharacterized protein LOC121371534 [Gigantopelta aegis]